MMTVIFTRIGHAKFLARINEQQKRVKLIGSEVGEEAGINCDWHDNFGYEDARRRLDQESKRLAEMMNVAQAATVQEVADQTEVVAVGSTVELESDGRTKILTIGAYGETDPQNGLVSYDSPIAQPMMAARVGDTIEVVQAGKRLTFEVVNILSPEAKYRDLIEKLFGLKADAEPSISSE